MGGRVAKAPIVVPEGVTIDIKDNGNVFSKGKQGEMSVQLHPKITLRQDSGSLIVEHGEGDREAYVLSGTMRALVANMVHGVSVGFESSLEMRGVGYRAAMQGAKLVLSVGYSHPVEMEVPAGLKVEIPAQTQIVIKGADKQKVTQFAANIRRTRPPEPYKGKGIRYVGEVVIMKEGKKK